MSYDGARVLEASGRPIAGVWKGSKVAAIEEAFLGMGINTRAPP